VSGETQQVLDFTEKACRTLQVRERVYGNALDRNNDAIVFELASFVPCPPELQDSEEGSFSSVGYRAFYPEHSDSFQDRLAALLEDDPVDVSPSELLAVALSGKMLEVNTILTYPWVKEAGIETVEELQKFLREKDSRYEDEGRKRRDNLDKHGYGSWYDWAIAKWGTKWDVSCTDLDYQDLGNGQSTATYTFESAWSPPEAGIIAISAQLPGLTLRLEYREEGMGFAGAMVVVAGSVITQTDSETEYSEEEED
jgi:hypothetical protein